MNGSSFAEVVAAALLAARRETPILGEMRRIEAAAAAGLATPGARRRHSTLWLTLALRRSGRARVPDDLAAVATAWHDLHAEVHDLRLRVEVDAAFGSDDAPLPL